MKRSNVMNLLLQMMPSTQQLSPAAPSSPTTASGHWAFLDEVDAPQWVDLIHEATLMGTLGDDPWFYRSHAHHETSLARIASVAISGNNSATKEKIRRSVKVGTQEKSSVSKSKASVKASAVKACLGGMQRVSGAGLKEGRLSSRPRVTLLSTSQTWPKNPKKVHIQRPLQRKIAAATAASSDSSRQAVREPSSDEVTPKKSYEAKIGHLRRVVSSASSSTPEARKTTPSGGTGGNSRSSDQSVTGTVRSSRSSVVNAFDSPKPSLKLYRLPSPPRQASNNSSSRDGLIVKSSPSDMIFSSDASPTTSSSSPDSILSRFTSESSKISVSEIVSAERETEKSKLHQPRSVSLPVPNSAHVEVNEPSLEVSSFKVSDRNCGVEDVDGDVDEPSPTNSPWNRQGFSTMARLKTSRSFGPPMRLKEIEKVGSSSMKRGSATRTINTQDVILPDKLIGADKLIGSQATHPILEKLRKSWGSALRVKQRQDAELLMNDSRIDVSCQNSGAVEQKVAGGTGTPRNQRSEKETKLESNATVLYSNNDSRNLGLKKGDSAYTQWEVEDRGKPGSEVFPTSSSEGQVLGIHIDRADKHFLAQQISSETVIMVPSMSTTSPGLSVPAASGKLSKSKSMGTVDHKSLEKSSLAGPALKSGLTKIQANHQRSKCDLNLKFKKQYPHTEAGISKALPLKGNKENMNLDVGVKPQKSLSPGMERKKKMQNYVRSSMPTSSARQIGQIVRISSVALPANVVRTSPPARNVVAGKAAIGCCRPTTTVGQEPADSSRKSSESLDRKLNNLAVLRGSTPSLLKLTKQKSEKITPTFSKEATSTGPKGCKSSGQVADESVAISTEDRKSRVAPKYEPRLHGVKAIREWEAKSGRRYYDLQPGERQKVNQEITAASKAITKRSSA